MLHVTQLYSRKRGSVICHPKGVQLYVTPKWSSCMLSQKGPVLYHSKRIQLYVIPKGSSSMSPQKGPLLCHPKKVQFYAIQKGSSSISTQRVQFYVIQKGPVVWHPSYEITSYSGITVLWTYLTIKNGLTCKCCCYKFKLNLRKILIGFTLFCHFSFDIWARPSRGPQVWVPHWRKVENW